MSHWSNMGEVKEKPKAKPHDPSVYGPRWDGPRNLPKPSQKKLKRRRVKLTRRTNRGAYSGQ